MRRTDLMSLNKRMCDIHGCMNIGVILIEDDGVKWECETHASGKRILNLPQLNDGGKG